MKKIEAKEFLCNPFTMIGDEWLLLTAGDRSGIGTMTASWGGLGVLWMKNVATVYLRPQRHTKVFFDKHDIFTISVLAPEFKKAHDVCGRQSGRDVDKIALTGLRPLYLEGYENAVTFEQAKTALVCKKIYRDTIKPEFFIDPSIDQNYPGKDYHYFYIGEILEVWG